MKIPQEPPESPSLSDVAPERLAVIFGSGIGPTVNGRYLHWDDLRRRTPPSGLTREEWWLALHFARLPGRKTLPFDDTEGRPFTYVLTDEALEMLHRIDRFASGRIDVPEAITNEATRDRYLVSSLMEEAIASSLLEGAATTQREAKALLRSGRPPRTHGERMVVNNYRTMHHIRADLQTPLSVDMMLEIHRLITDGTLEDPDDAGRFQVPGEQRVDVGDPNDPSVVFHRPPPAEKIPELAARLIAFANSDTDQPFVHPVVRAVMIHFFVSYLHPFVDGNGRTARALFYRSMLRQGYWLAEFLSISRLLQQAPAQYGRSFLHTETDNADFTYFLLYQLSVICRAIDELFAYLAERVAEVRRVERVLKTFPGLSHRQLTLLSDALRRPDAVYTFATHQRSHGVVYQTARADLLDLEALGFLERRQIGREFRFYPVPDLTQRILGDDS